MSMNPHSSSEAVERNRSYHTLLAEDEAALIPMQLPKIARICHLLAQYAQPGGRLADVGAFTGYAASRYAAACRPRSVCCFDISEAALERCRQRGFDTEQWNCEERAPGADGTFTAIVAADIIEHLVNTDDFISELRRMLVPGGLLIVSTPNLAYWLNRLRLLRGWVPWSYPGVSSTFRRSDAIDRNHLRINTPYEWRGFFERNGFHLLRRTGYSIFHQQTATLWGRARAAFDAAADARAPDLAFGNIYALRALPPASPA